MGSAAQELPKLMSAISLFREMLREQVEYRELLYQMTMRDLLLRYKQTVMGFGWAIFMPLVNTAVFSVIFTRVAQIETPVPYPLFAFCGLLVWNFFAVVAAVLRALADQQLEPRHEGLFPARDLSVLGRARVPRRLRRSARSVLVALMIYYQRRR